MFRTIIFGSLRNRRLFRYKRHPASDVAAHVFEKFLIKLFCHEHVAFLVNKIFTVAKNIIFMLHFCVVIYAVKKSNVCEGN